MELAIATQTAPADWRDEPDAVIATALDVLEAQAERIKRHTRGARRHG